MFFLYECETEQITVAQGSGTVSSILFDQISDFDFKFRALTGFRFSDIKLKRSEINIVDLTPPPSGTIRRFLKSKFDCELKFRHCV